MKNGMIDYFNRRGNGKNIEEIRRRMTMSEIKDSGDRTQFETGAVRDLREGKGRCDLMPLDVIAEILNDGVINHIAWFMSTGNPDYLKHAICSFESITEMDDYTALLEVAVHYEDGCKKYGERNWEKGIPLHCYIDSAIRHYLKMLRGDDDERHDRAFMWNILGAMWTFDHRKDLIDIPFSKPDIKKEGPKTKFTFGHSPNTLKVRSTKETIDKIFVKMLATFNTQGNVCIADVMDLLGHSDDISYSDNFYGWTNLDDVRIKKIDEDNHELIFPAFQLLPTKGVTNDEPALAEDEDTYREAKYDEWFNKLEKDLIVKKEHNTYKDLSGQEYVRTGPMCYEPVKGVTNE